ncbi:hypothetical protein QBC40DRAFT_70618 [Triangularia verruculosa]|uniref:Uncharacterized protein n=1 Tax=Triangularia verruculosa TaxID=2587418 RepID=A0AAN6XIY1_9PEZI|nr:hypothetical protein QBC40DRAFT_70618 [Triangularia verruculosa]
MSALVSACCVLGIEKAAALPVSALTLARIPDGVADQAVYGLQPRDSTPPAYPVFADFSPPPPPCLLLSSMASKPDSKHNPPFAAAPDTPTPQSRVQPPRHTIPCIMYCMYVHSACSTLRAPGLGCPVNPLAGLSRSAPAIPVGQSAESPLPSTQGRSGRRRLWYLSAPPPRWATGGQYIPTQYCCRPLNLTPWPTSPALPYCSEISRLPATPPATLCPRSNWDVVPDPPVKSRVLSLYGRAVAAPISSGHGSFTRMIKAGDPAALTIWQARL